MGDFYLGAKMCMIHLPSESPNEWGTKWLSWQRRLPGNGTKNYWLYDWKCEIWKCDTWKCKYKTCVPTEKICIRLTAVNVFYISESFITCLSNLLNEQTVQVLRSSR